MEATPAAPWRPRRIAFRTAAGLTTAFLLVALVATFPLLFTNWLPADAWLAVRPDRSPGDQVHRLHSLALAVISWATFVGVALQFHRPERKFGALLMSLATVVAVALGLALSGSFSVAGLIPFLVLPLVTCALHPSAREIVRPWRADPPMLALTLVAAVPWIAFALDIGDAARQAGPAGDAEHLGFMAIVGVAIPLWALLGTTDRAGWVFPAGAAVLGSACVGLQSLIFPDAQSGLRSAWALAALAWCIAYGIAARFRTQRERGSREDVGSEAAERSRPAGVSSGGSDG